MRLFPLSILNLLRGPPRILRRCATEDRQSPGSSRPGRSPRRRRRGTEEGSVAKFGFLKVKSKSGRKASKGLQMPTSSKTNFATEPKSALVYTLSDDATEIHPNANSLELVYLVS